jgi:hypothetical protein
MRRTFMGSLCLLFAFALVPLTGCGSGNETVLMSEEAKKADAVGQDAMREFMQSKSAKPASKSAPKTEAVAPKPEEK